jgi:hypothetical protein
VVVAPADLEETLTVAATLAMVVEVVPVVVVAATLVEAMPATVVAAEAGEPAATTTVRQPQLPQAGHLHQPGRLSPHLPPHLPVRLATVVVVALVDLEEILTVAATLAMEVVEALVVVAVTITAEVKLAMVVVVAAVARAETQAPRPSPHRGTRPSPARDGSELSLSVYILQI